MNLRIRVTLFVTLSLFALLGVFWFADRSQHTTDEASSSLQTLTYKEVNGERLLLDFYPALNSDPKSPPATVLYIHGGCFTYNDRKENVFIQRILPRLLAEGFAVASADYRLAPKALYPAQLDDVRAAREYLRAKAKALGIDPQRLAAFGLSAGAYLSMRLADDEPANAPPRALPLTAVAAYFGRTDFTYQYSEAEDCAEKAMGVRRNPKNLAIFRTGSVTSYVGPRFAPIFIYHGLKDTAVPPLHSLNLVELLKQYQRPVEFVSEPNSQHMEFTDETLEESIVFLKSQLNP